MTYVNQYAKTSKQMYVKQTDAFLIQSRYSTQYRYNDLEHPKSAKILFYDEILIYLKKRSYLKIRCFPRGKCCLLLVLCSSVCSE